MLGMLVGIQAQSNQEEVPMLIGSILTSLTNLSLHDTTNVKIRLYGAHIIGKILMRNCPALMKEGESPCKYTNDPDENIKLQHELQLHCLRSLRFLYSVEKNRKTFKMIFPPQIFGSFIDVGNFNNEFKAYIPLLRKINKKLPLENLIQIQQNFTQMGNFQKLQDGATEKFINGFKVMELIGKGAFGSVYLV